MIIFFTQIKKQSIWLLDTPYKIINLSLFFFLLNFYIYDYFLTVMNVSLSSYTVGGHIKKSILEESKYNYTFSAKTVLMASWAANGGELCVY